MSVYLQEVIMEKRLKYHEEKAMKKLSEDLKKESRKTMPISKGGRVFRFSPVVKTPKSDSSP